MGKLREKQTKFAFAIGRLLLYAEAVGYGVTFGDAYRDPRVFGEVGKSKGYGHASSAHKSRLALDLNLFIDGEYVGNDTAHHGKLHDFWDMLGGAPRIADDLNHYSFSEGGVR